MAIGGTEAKDTRAREAYFTASQWQLVWARFRQQRAALVAGFILVTMILMGFFAPFLSPYDPTIAGRDKDYQNGAPQIPKFSDENGFSARPFLYTLERTRSIKTNFRWVTEVNKDKRRYVQFFVRGWKYHLLDINADLPGNAFDFRIQLFDLPTCTCSASTAAASTCSAPTQAARTSSRAPCTRCGPRSPSAPSAC